MASFAVDGGLIAVGVAEDKESGKFELSPVALAGLAERVDQVARSVIDPPLLVGCIEVPADVGGGVGYLLITVPASPLAPHMVDGKYRGRGDTTNVILTDAEVRRLHERAMLQQERAWGLLAEEVARDPSPTVDHPQAHLFVIAQPVSADAELLFRAAASAGLAEWVRERVLSGPPCRGAGQSFSPDLGSIANDVTRRADGVAVASYYLGPGRVPQPGRDGDSVDETSLLELEVREDGGLRLFCGRASDMVDDGRVAFEALIAGLTLRVLVAAAEVIASTRYGGSWDLGMSVTNLRGCRSYLVHGTFGFRSLDVPYSADSYEQVIRVDGEVLTARPLSALESLYGRLHRGLSGGAKAIPEMVANIST